MSENAFVLTEGSAMETTSVQKFYLSYFENKRNVDIAEQHLYLEGQFKSLISSYYCFKFNTLKRDFFS